MKTIGEILRNERLKKNYTISQVADVIKTKEKFVVAIENNDFSSFAGEVFALLHVKNYAEFVGIESTEIIPFFRRTWEMNRGKYFKEEQKANNSFSPNSKIDNFGRNFSKIVLVTGISLIILCFVGFLILQYERNIIHPKLEINYPASNIKVTVDKILIKGKTDKDNKIFINGEEISVSDAGDFNFNVDLNSGLNKFVIRAINSYQKETQSERIVLRE